MKPRQIIDQYIAFQNPVRKSGAKELQDNLDNLLECLIKNPAEFRHLLDETNANTSHAWEQQAISDIDLYDRIAQSLLWSDKGKVFLLQGNQIDHLVKADMVYKAVDKYRPRELTSLSAILLINWDFETIPIDVEGAPLKQGDIPEMISLMLERKDFTTVALADCRINASFLAALKKQHSTRTLSLRWEKNISWTSEELFYESLPLLVSGSSTSSSSLSSVSLQVTGVKSKAIPHDEKAQKQENTPLYIFSKHPKENVLTLKDFLVTEEFLGALNSLYSGVLITSLQLENVRFSSPAILKKFLSRCNVLNNTLSISSDGIINCQRSNTLQTNIRADFSGLPADSTLTDGPRSLQMILNRLEESQPESKMVKEDKTGREIYLTVKNYSSPEFPFASRAVTAITIDPVGEMKLSCSSRFPALKQLELMGVTNPQAQMKAVGTLESFSMTGKLFDCKPEEIVELLERNPRLKKLNIPASPLSDTKPLHDYLTHHPHHPLQEIPPSWTALETRISPYSANPFERMEELKNLYFELINAIKEIESESKIKSIFNKRHTFIEKFIQLKNILSNYSHLSNVARNMERAENALSIFLAHYIHKEYGESYKSYTVDTSKLKQECMKYPDYFSNAFKFLFEYHAPFHLFLLCKKCFPHVLKHYRFEDLFFVDYWAALDYIHYKVRLQDCRDVINVLTELGVKSDAIHSKTAFNLLSFICGVVVYVDRYYSFPIKEDDQTYWTITDRNIREISEIRYWQGREKSFFNQLEYKKVCEKLKSAVMKIFSPSIFDSADRKRNKLSVKIFMEDIFKKADSFKIVYTATPRRSLVNLSNKDWDNVNWGPQPATPTPLPFEHSPLDNDEPVAIVVAAAVSLLPPLITPSVEPDKVVSLSSRKESYSEEKCLSPIEQPSETGETLLPLQPMMKSPSAPPAFVELEGQPGAALVIATPVAAVPVVTAAPIIASVIIPAQNEALQRAPDHAAFFTPPVSVLQPHELAMTLAAISLLKERGSAMPFDLLTQIAELANKAIGDQKQKHAENTFLKHPSQK